MEAGKGQLEKLHVEIASLEEAKRDRESSVQKLNEQNQKLQITSENLQSLVAAKMRELEEVERNLVLHEKEVRAGCEERLSRFKEASEFKLSQEKASLSAKFNEQQAEIDVLHQQISRQSLQ